MKTRAKEYKTWQGPASTGRDEIKRNFFLSGVGEVSGINQTANNYLEEVEQFPNYLKVILNISHYYPQDKST